MFNIGDYVARNSYNNDLIFKIIRIENDIYYLKGVSVRLYADSFKEDLLICNDFTEKDTFKPTIDEYRDATALVASEYENVYFMDNLKELPITYDNYKQYLCDGLHLNAEGQKIYTDYFVSVIEKIESDANQW